MPLREYVIIHKLNDGDVIVFKGGEMIPELKGKKEEVTRKVADFVETWLKA